MKLSRVRSNRAQQVADLAISLICSHFTPPIIGEMVYLRLFSLSF